MPKFRTARRWTKRLLATCGAPHSSLIEGVNLLFLYGRWRREHPAPVDFPERKLLYDHLQHTVIGDEPISYLEFGVYRGESFGHWLGLNCHPASRFLGFDTFTGLPESWKTAGHTAAAGSFDVQGQIPRFDDDRARMVKGLFQDTLPAIVETDMPELATRRLVIHLDADLYSSTLYVLTALHGVLVPGTILIFDEFNSAAHEFRAFLDYTTAYRVRCRVLGTAGLIGEQTAFVVEPDTH